MPSISENIDKIGSGVAGLGEAAGHLAKAYGENGVAKVLTSALPGLAQDHGNSLASVDLSKLGIKEAAAVAADGAMKTAAIVGICALLAVVVWRVSSCPCPDFATPLPTLHT